MREKPRLLFNNKTIAASLIALSLIALSVGARSLGLGSSGYWIDEMSSIHFAGHEYWGALLWDNSPVLYHFLLKIWISLFGNHEAATRSLSVLFSTLTTVLWMREGYRRSGLVGVVICGLTHAALWLSVVHGRETRMYALFELSATIYFLLILRLVEGAPVRLAKLIGAIILLIFTHFLSVVPLFVGGICLLLSPKSKFTRGKYLATILVSLLIAAAMTAFIRWESLLWQEMKFVIETGSRWPWSVMLQIFGGAVGALGFVTLSVSGVAQRNRIAAFSSIAVILVFVSATVGGLLMARSVFLPRYFTYVSPLIMLTVLGALTASSHMKFNYKILNAIAWLMFIGGQSIKAVEAVNFEHPPWREAGQFIAQQKNPIIFTTRPLSMKSPYFESVPFIKIERKKTDWMSELLLAQKRGQQPYIIENYWGFEASKDELQKTLEEFACVGLAKRLTNSSLDSLVVMKVDCLADKNER